MGNYKFKGTTNWRVRHFDGNDLDSQFFVEADLNKNGHYPTLEVMQEDYGDHNGYDKHTRMADAKLIVSAPDLLQAAIDFIEKVDSGRARSTDSYKKFKAAVNKALDIKENMPDTVEFKFSCYEIHRANMPQYGCTRQCNECANIERH